MAVLPAYIWTTAIVCYMDNVYPVMKLLNFKEFTWEYRCSVSQYDHKTHAQVLKDLNWSQLYNESVNFKILLPAYKALHDLSPTYIYLVTEHQPRLALPSSIITAEHPSNWDFYMYDSAFFLWCSKTLEWYPWNS